MKSIICTEIAEINNLHSNVIDLQKICFLTRGILEMHVIRLFSQINSESPEVSEGACYRVSRVSTGPAVYCAVKIILSQARARIVTMCD